MVDPNPETEQLGGTVAAGEIDLQALEDFVTERNIDQRLAEMIRNGEVSTQKVLDNTGYFDSTRPDQLIAYTQLDTWGPFEDEIEKRALARRGGGHANYTYPLSRTVNRMITLMPSVDADDIPIKGDETSRSPDDPGMSVGLLIPAAIAVLVVVYLQL